MNIMTKRGSQDNVITYEHYCDTLTDMNNIKKENITLGSICVVLKGESNALELYIADSTGTWNKM